MNIKKSFSSIINKPEKHWQNYKSFFNLTVFRYFVTWFAIVPLLASLFLKVPSTFEFELNGKSSSYEFHLGFGLPFSWKCLWLSSLFFVLANALYIIFCPSFIRKYNSFSDYLKMNHSPRWMIWEAKNIFKKKIDIDKFFLRIKTKSYVDEIDENTFKIKKNEYNTTRKHNVDEFKDFGVIVEEKRTVLYFMHENKFYSLGLPTCSKGNKTEGNNITSLVEKELFWEIFGRYAASYPIIRIIILILLVLSFTLFFIIFVQNIINGILFLF